MKIFDCWFDNLITETVVNCLHFGKNCRKKKDGLNMYNIHKITVTVPHLNSSSDQSWSLQNQTCQFHLLRWCCLHSGYFQLKVFVVVCLRCSLDFCTSVMLKLGCHMPCPNLGADWLNGVSEKNLYFFWGWRKIHEFKHCCTSNY